MLNDQELLELHSLAELAAKKVAIVYGQDFEVEFKSDNSPVTIADKEASIIILNYLEKKYPHWPAISEEGYIPSYHERKNYETFWLIDPVDGTKEFIKKTGEFTVNIALIHQGSPVAGVIYHPLRNIGYIASKGNGAFKLNAGRKERIFYKDFGQILKVAGSRNHSSKSFYEFINLVSNDIKHIEITRLGSSFKFCLVANGILNVYPRFGQTMEWDTAAGHAICKEAGLNIYQYGSDKELEYNKQSLINPWFIASNLKLLETLKWTQRSIL